MDPIVVGVMLDRTVLGLAWLAERTDDPHERDVLTLAAMVVERELADYNATNRAVVAHR
jgi:hypothetical protein